MFSQVRSRINAIFFQVLYLHHARTPQHLQELQKRFIYILLTAGTARPVVHMTTGVERCTRVAPMGGTVWLHSFVRQMIRGQLEIGNVVVSEQCPILQFLFHDRFSFFNDLHRK